MSNDIPDVNIPDKGELHKELMKGEQSVSRGSARTKKYDKYYDITNTILIAAPGALNSIDQDSNLYQSERVHDSLQRNAEIAHLINDGIDILYARVSQGGTQKFSQENAIYPGDTKEYYNVYELRLRSPTAGLPYRFTEHDIERTCCPTGTTITGTVSTTVSNTPLPVSISGQPISASISNTPLPITNAGNRNITWIHSAEQVAPGAGTVLVTRTVTAGMQGFIYGFLITSQEANNFLINWTSGGVARSIRVVFGGAGTTEDSETDIALNEGLPADAGTVITITNVTAGAVGMIYQARLRYAEG